MDDAATFALLKSCATTAVFQLNHADERFSQTIYNPIISKKLLRWCVCFVRPLQSGMVDDFINRKHGRARADYFIPILNLFYDPPTGSFSIKNK